MLPLAMAAISGGLSLMSGLGAQKSAKKQAKTQAAMDEFARRYNADRLGEYNSEVRNLGRELLETPQVTDTTQANRSWVDVDAMMLAADKAGFNPVTWLQAGAMQSYTQSASYNHTEQNDPVAAFQMMMPQLQQIQAGTATNIPSALSVIGDAGQAALKSYQTDMRLADSQSFQERLLGLKLNAIQQGKSTSGFGSTPRTTSSGGYFSKGGQAGASGALTVNKPQEVSASIDGSTEPDSNPIIQYFDTGSGWMPAMSTKYKEASEDDFMSEIPWHFSNRVMPMLGYNRKPPPVPLYGDERWTFNPFTQQYETVNGPKQSLTDQLRVKVTPTDPGAEKGLWINGTKVFPFW